MHTKIGELTYERIGGGCMLFYPVEPFTVDGIRYRMERSPGPMAAYLSMWEYNHSRQTPNLPPTEEELDTYVRTGVLPCKPSYAFPPF